MLQVYIHIVWGTWDRAPILVPDVKRSVYACILAKCRALKVVVHAIGGTEDHMHLLLELPATITIADLVKHIKGSSSHLASHSGQQRVEFKWQGAYGAFAVSKSVVPSVIEYIEGQEQHHRNGTTIRDHEIPWEEPVPPPWEE
jgi:putative transposase